MLSLTNLKFLYPKFFIIFIEFLKVSKEKKTFIFLKKLSDSKPTKLASLA